MTFTVDSFIRLFRQCRYAKLFSPAQMAKLVDALASGASDENRGSSSLLLGTNFYLRRTGVYLMPNVVLHHQDLPEGISFGASVAVDTETTGLNFARDRLCLVQLSAGDGTCHIIQFEKNNYDAPVLKKLLADKNILKIFQYARFDVAAIKKFLGVDCQPVYCTKIASKLARTNALSHSLKTLCQELLGVELEKENQCSDWGTEKLTEEQIVYAANDVLYLHRIKEILDSRLKREGRTQLAAECFDFILTRSTLDISGWSDDIFAH